MGMELATIIARAQRVNVSHNESVIMFNLLILFALIRELYYSSINCQLLTMEWNRLVSFTELTLPLKLVKR